MLAARARPDPQHRAGAHDFGGAVDDLVKWLGEQLDADGRLAQAAADELGGLPLGAEWHYDGHAVETTRERDLVATASQDHMEVGCGEHIAAHDPARVLREIDAKRRLLDEFSQTGAVPDTPERRASPSWKGHFGYLQGLARAVHLFALPYADRPGYREEWRP